jgi:predicted membrane-bound mannosyltransferase
VRRAAKVDANATQIESALKAAGCTVQSLAPIGRGCPDALAAKDGLMWLFEYKNPRGKDEVNEAQTKWHIAWNAPVYVVRTPDEALAVIRAKEIA